MTRSATGSTPARCSASCCASIPGPAADRPYTIPPDNPFADGPPRSPEIWSAGLRNPWRFSFDPATGDLWIGDVGQNAVEEIDLVTGGARARGGARTSAGAPSRAASRYNDDQESPDHWPPIYEYRHADGGCSVTGGVVYRGNAIPALRGAYLFGDYCSPGRRGPRGRRRAGGRRRDRSPTTPARSPASGPTPAARSTCCRSRARCTGSTRPERSPRADPPGRRIGGRRSAPGSHEDALERVVVLDAVAGAEHHALERRVDELAPAPSSPATAAGPARAACRRRRPG